MGASLEMFRDAEIGDPESWPVARTGLIQGRVQHDRNVILAPIGGAGLFNRLKIGGRR